MKKFLLLAMSASQVVNAAQAPPGVQDFYQNLVNQPPSAELLLAEVTKVVDQIPALSKEDVSKALPSIFAALAHSNINVKIAATAALLALDQRPDSAELLKPYLPAIYDLLNDPNPGFSSVALMGLAYLKPMPPADVLSTLLVFTQRTDRALGLQARALAVLLKQAPNQPEVVNGTEQFVSRPLDLQSRMTILDAIGLVPRNNSDRLIAIVLSALHDDRPAIRERAIYNVSRLGNAALSKASPDLQRLALDGSEPAEVRAAADKALRVLGGEKPDGR